MGYFLAEFLLDSNLDTSNYPDKLVSSRFIFYDLIEPVVLLVMELMEVTRQPRS